MADKYDCLKLENQLCFPLYACAKEDVRHYKPFLDKLDLTYTQYIVMMVLWEKKSVNVKTLGENLYLDSGTLTPLLKRLETKGLIRRARSHSDERALDVSITEKGEALREDALDIPQEINACMQLQKDEIHALYTLLYKTLDGVEASIA